MTSRLRKLIGIGAFSLLAATAQAGASLNGVRIGARDVATVEAAQANAAGDLVIMQRQVDDGKDTMAHVVFDVTDMTATVRDWKAAGGRMEREPFEFGATGIHIGMAIDPAGNHLEFIQPKI